MWISMAGQVNVSYIQSKATGKNMSKNHKTRNSGKKNKSDGYWYRTKLITNNIKCHICLSNPCRVNMRAKNHD